MITITRPQREALHALWTRGNQQPRGQGWQGTYREFRRTVQREVLSDTVLVVWCGMTVGIEPDGYTHT